MVRRHAVPRAFRSGEVIFNEGDAGDGLYIVHSGLIRITATSTPDRQHVLSRMEPGDYFGEMAVFDVGPRSASAVALEDSRLSFVPMGAV